MVYSQAAGVGTVVQAKFAQQRLAKSSPSPPLVA
jgi:hypothetical protein